MILMLAVEKKAAKQFLHDHRQVAPIKSVTRNILLKVSCANHGITSVVCSTTLFSKRESCLHFHELDMPICGLRCHSLSG